MSDPMNLRQFEHWLNSLANPGKWGWMPEHKKIGKYLRDQTKARLRRHSGADGRPWPARYTPPRPRVGAVLPMIVGPLGEIPARVASVREGGKHGVVTQKIKSRKGKARAVAFRRKYGPPLKPVPALVRKRGRFKATDIWDFLVGRGFFGRAMQMGKDFLRYGYTPGTRWIEELQFGGTYKGGRIPPREILGLNEADMKVIENIYADGFARRKAMEGK